MGREVTNVLVLRARVIEARGRLGLYGQAARIISTGKLNALLRFHIPPINQVVYLGP